MLRVNLLGGSEPTAPSAYVDPGAGGDGVGGPDRKPTILLAAIVLGVIGLCAFQYISGRSTLATLDEEINQLNQEKARLAPIIAQVREYEAKLAELEEKEKLIETLKSQREGPVRMLDALSQELPDFVWLTKLRQAAGGVTVDGMAASYVSVADYIKRLEESDWFSGVELIDAKISNENDQEFTEFQLRTQLIAPGSGGQPGQVGQPGQPAAVGAGAAGSR